MHLSKFAFVQSALFGHCFVMTLVHLVRPTSQKHWPKRLNSNGSLSFCVSDSQGKIFGLKLESLYAKRNSAPNQAWLSATWPVITLAPFSKETLIWLDYFRPSLISLSGMQSAPKDIQGVYQLNWGKFWASTISDIVTIFTLLALCNVLVRLRIYY